MSQNSSLLNEDWIYTPEGSHILHSLCTKNENQLRSYGLLEHPILPAQPVLEDVQYKIVVVGKGGVGKTSCIARLAGHNVPESHWETAGIQTTKMFWPVKILHLNKPVLMNLTFWDAGEMAMKKFDHILPSLKTGVDCVLFVFSFVDKGSWEEIPHLITRLTDPNDNIAKVVIGTKFDQYALSEVSQRELREFESCWKSPVLRICNIPPQDPNQGMSDTIPILNSICNQLWQKDILKAQDS